MATRKLDFTAAWNDAMSLFKANAEVTIILIGLFGLVPLLAVNLFMPQPEMLPDQDPNEALAMLGLWFSQNWYWIIGVFLAGAIGNMALMLVILNETRPTVGAALKTAFTLVPLVFVVQLIAGAALMLGMLLLILPGIYLAIKFLLVSAVIAAEPERSPIAVLRRSWQLTRGNSLRIFGFFVIILVVAFVTLLVANLIVGVPAGLLLSDNLAEAVTSVVSLILQVALNVVLMFVTTAIYRQISVEPPAIR